jgi:isocitrate dehydrogenase (NAD+)
MARSVTVIKGDGVGTEVVDTALGVLSTSGVDLSWEVHEAGAAASIKVGDSLPTETVRSIRRTGVCLRGPLEEPVGLGFHGAVTRLRAELDVFASVQRSRSSTALVARPRDVDLVIVHEVSEGEYAATERHSDQDGDAVQYVSTTTRSACQRVVRFAFSYALRARRRHVTLVHPGPILELAAKLFRDAGRDAARM